MPSLSRPNWGTEPTAADTAATQPVSPPPAEPGDVIRHWLDAVRAVETARPSLTAVGK